MGHLDIKIGNMETGFPAPGSVYRSFGQQHERIGVGFIDKTGVTRDLVDYQAPTWSMVFVLHGNGTCQFADGPHYQLQAGDCFIRPARRQHTGLVDPDSSWFEAFLDLGPELSATLTKARIIKAEPLVWQWNLDDKRIQRLVSLRDRLAAASEGQLGACCVAIQEFIIDAQRSAEEIERDDPIEEACQLLSIASLRRDNLRDWISAQGIDYEQFRKAFKKRLGISPGQYRIRRRMDRACELLQHSDLSIAAIAYELGYPTPYEFSAQFKQQMGITPSRYRR